MATDCITITMDLVDTGNWVLHCPVLSNLRMFGLGYHSLKRRFEDEYLEQHFEDYREHEATRWSNGFGPYKVTVAYIVERNGDITRHRGTAAGTTRGTGGGNGSY